MGYYSRATLMSGPGVRLGEGVQNPAPEEIAANWSRIISLIGAVPYPDANSALMDMLAGPQELPHEESATPLRRRT
jgi:hypothetical protein